MGTNCVPLIADLGWFYYERINNLHKSKQYVLIDTFNDASRYLDDIFNIDIIEFENIFLIFYIQRNFSLTKQILQTKKTSFLDFKIKVIDYYVHSSIYDKRDDFGFTIVNFPWLSSDVPRLLSCGVDISHLVRFARCCTSVLDFHSKNFQITSNLLTHGYRYHKLRKTFGKFYRSYILWAFMQIWWNIVSRLWF